ncbi:MAG: NADH-quinone oxidoreductase subunit C, partial [Thermodesulfovibrio sp.]|nr:NADH-quinone oxidoreductase subunit C [Thermodesulfovibrio sp.]
MSSSIAELKNNYKEFFYDSKESEELVVIFVEREKIKDIAQALISEGLRFVHLTAIDFSEQKNKIELNYFFFHLEEKKNIIIKSEIDISNSSIASIADIIPGITWAERECNDMFGIKFEGHPDPRRLVLPDDWPDNLYPLRKNFSYNSKPPVKSEPTMELKKPGEGRTVIPLGPFYPSLEEPAYFRLIVEGEEIVDF